MPPKNDQGNAGSKGGDDRSVAGKNMPSKNEGKDSGPGRDNLPPKKWIGYPKDHSDPDLKPDDSYTNTGSIEKNNNPR